MTTKTDTRSVATKTYAKAMITWGFATRDLYRAEKQGRAAGALRTRERNLWLALCEAKAAAGL